MVSVAMSQVGMTELIFVNPGVKVKGQYYCDVLLLSADASSNQSCRKTLFIHKTMLLTAKLVIFSCSVISQGKVVALDR